MSSLYAVGLSYGEVKCSKWQGAAQSVGDQCCALLKRKSEFVSVAEQFVDLICLQLLAFAEV